jgi:hypothetical protein
MTDTHSDTDSISDHDDGDEDSSISSAVRELCDRLRANDPRMLGFVPFEYDDQDYENDDEDYEDERIEYSEGERIKVFQALKENTQVKHIQLWLHGYTKRSAKAAANYLESSQALQTIDLRVGRFYDELPAVVCLLLQALSRNESVTKLCVDTEIVRFASVVFQELLTRTQTLKTMAVIRYQHDPDEDLDEMQTASITSGFANNTTLRDLEFRGWQEADLVPVLAALQDHPALQKIQFRPTYSSGCLLGLSGLEVLLRSQDSKVKELVLERVGNKTVGLHAVIRELGRNTTVTKLAIIDSVLSRENVQELKSMLRRNTALESLDLESSDLRSAGLTEIAPVL